MNHFRTAAAQLAADRSTFVLPIFIALIAFIIAIGAAYWRIIGVEPHPDAWTNVEAYSIAMSAPFLHIIPAVFFSAIIGASQTEVSVPNILNSLRTKLAKVDESWMPTEEIKKHMPLLSVPGAVEYKSGKKRDSDPQTCTIDGNLPSRIASGGLYAWRPDMLHSLPLIRHHQTWKHVLLSFSFVGASVFVASWISYRVPPQGFDCRNVAQMSLLGVWIASFALDHLFFNLLPHIPTTTHNPQHRGGYNPLLYTLTFLKDTLTALAVVTNIMVVQVGIFNRCGCFTLWGKAPLGLPQIPEARRVLMDRIAREWPAVTFSWIGLELVLCVGVAWHYRDAFRVYMQKDDGTSNLDWVPGWVVVNWGKGGGKGWEGG